MSGTTNKVKYGIKNAHYAIKGQGGYGTPVPIPGAKSISLEPKGELYVFYADDIEYYRCPVNNGYEGDAEFALIPEDFLKDVMGDTLETTANVLVEHADAQVVEFALGFELTGDVKASRFWFYNCVATRPSVEGDTKEQSINVKTEKVKISSAPGSDGIVRARTTETTPAETYDAWFEAVFA